MSCEKSLASHALAFGAGAVATCILMKALHSRSTSSQCPILPSPPSSTSFPPAPAPSASSPSSPSKIYEWSKDKKPERPTVSCFDDVSAGFKEVQNHITNMVASISGGCPLEDKWEYTKGYGGGQSNVWESKSKEHGGIERGGVLFSSIGGGNLPPAALAKHKLPPGSSFKTCGVSLVLHPHNPYVPTIHMNVRHMQLENGKWWFGGGIDLTPYYPNFGEIVDFHVELKNLCEKHGFPYQDYKEYCDKYFVNHHRLEMRGIGGIFFENLGEDIGSLQKIFDFCFDLGMFMADYYSNVLINHLNDPYSEEERDFQLIRRARYTEFNLIHDRGTKFGLQAKGRIESIFCSLPAEARWRYNYTPEKGSREEKTMKFYLKPQEWTTVQNEGELKESSVEETKDVSSL